MRLNKVQKAAVAALEDIKARDITVLDTRTLTAIYDTLIIATAESARQTKALARNVSDKVKAAGGHVISTEGEESGEWVLVDCADMVVHIMLPTTRALYNLEELWTPPTPVKPPKAEKPAKPAASQKPAKAAAPKAAPAGRKPAAKTPAAKKPATKKPASKKPAVKVAAKKPVARKPAAKKPAAKPAAKPASKPAAKRSAAKKRAA
ncbi:ribosome silencing factor [Casimicrobium huifangae]|uniref:ribosome silencing factor n=1 Tax=Casimicrobium huifangae TaxID=2591109 RepID=UPI0012EC8E8B|nr:ribosome silencing factor [Casimicrobium huifangae]